MHIPKQFALILPIAVAVLPQAAIGESDRHIIYMQQYQELINRAPTGADEAPDEQREQDAGITKKVSEELAAETELQNSAIEVSTEQQVVTLFGSVQSQQQKDLAEAVTARQENVKGLNSQLKVEHP